MARYVGDYDHDLIGLITRRALLTVNLISNSSLTTFRGVSSATTREFDLQYLPEIFLTSTASLGNREAACEIFSTPRFAQLYLSSTEYLKVELPFKGGDDRFKQFLEQANANPAIEKVNVIGEFVDTDFLTFWLHG